MPTNILFADVEENWSKWQPHLERCLSERGIDATLHNDPSDHSAEFIVYSPKSGLLDFTPFKHLRVVLSTWAGVERITPNQTLSVPLCRMVDPGLTAGMVEYCLGHIMRYHLDLDAHSGRREPVWDPSLMPKLARERTVGVLGLGALGHAVAAAAGSLGFDVHGWSRSAKRVEGVTCHHGPDGLDRILTMSEILVTLLPLTDATANLLDDQRLKSLPKGAFVINPGRGQLIVDQALTDALDSGHLTHATLDVFRQEPLPRDHPFWHHPNITVTPHIAAETRAETAADVIAENVLRAIKGVPLLHLVDRNAGY